MIKNTLAKILGTCASLIGGCSLQQKAIDETRLYLNGNEASIWAVDYDGINEVRLYDGNKLLLRDTLNRTYIKNPTGTLVGINNGRGDVYLDDSVTSGLYDGNFRVVVYDKKGNKFEKDFKKENGKVMEP